MKALLLGSLCLVACTSRDIVVGDLQEVTTLKAVPNRDLDILFVVDNSPSMIEEQQSLATNFPLMIDALSTLDGGLPNLHIGVVTSDLGTSGSQTQPGPAIGAGPGACAGTGMSGDLVQVSGMTDHFLSDIDDGAGGRTTNYTGALRDEFGTLALVGDQGCGFEQHLGAMRRALDGNPNNAGFLRPDANLAVVVLADEDDCSVADSAFFSGDTGTLGPLQSFRCFRFGVECDEDTNTVGAKTNCRPRATSPYLDDVQPFADFLVALKGDARKVMVAGVLGDPSPVAVELAAPPGGSTPIPTLSHSCTYPGPDYPQTADPAVRLAAFLDEFPGRSRLTSICDPDLSSAVADIGLSAKALMGDPCLTPDVLADTCDVTDVRDSAPDAPTHLPRCADGGATCFDVVADATACPNTPDHLRIQIHRDVDPTSDTWTHVRCQPR
jgi:hypothetical protein